MPCTVADVVEVRELGQIWAALPKTRSARSSEREVEILFKKKKITPGFQSGKRLPLY